MVMSHVELVASELSIATVVGLPTAAVAAAAVRSVHLPPRVADPGGALDPPGTLVPPGTPVAPVAPFRPVRMPRTRQAR